MPVTVEDFVRRVTESGLMEAGELEAFHASLPPGQRPADGQQLAQLLVAKSRLTDYQADALLRGNVAGLCLDDYIVLEKIGEGGMGVVFRARHRRMEREVAIKTLAENLVGSPEAVQRFYKEIRVAARLTHPNIVQAYDARESKGLHFLVMEYVRGRSLAQTLEQDGPLPVRRAIECILQAARGLEHAHRHGVVHRDIKPANLLVDQSGTVKILDLGLARLHSGLGDRLGDSSVRLTRTGQLMGTVDFLAPEQAVDTRSADQRSDIYALGCTLYQLLTGLPPYAGDTVLKKLLAHREAEVPSICTARADVPRDVDRVFWRMVAKRPEDRYASVADAARELENCLPQLESRQLAGDTVVGDGESPFAAAARGGGGWAGFARPIAGSPAPAGESPFREGTTASGASPAYLVSNMAAAEQERPPTSPGIPVAKPTRSSAGDATMAAAAGLLASARKPPLRQRLMLGLALASFLFSFGFFAGGLLGFAVWLTARRDLAAMQRGDLDARGRFSTRLAMVLGGAAAAITLLWLTASGCRAFSSVLGG